jgi:hypothetical protein
MKKSHLIFTGLFLILCEFLSFAQFISREDAGYLAENLFARYSKTADAGNLVISGDALMQKNGEDPAIYFFSEKKGGFLILAADKSAFPLLAWADSVDFSGNPADWPPALKEIIANWIEQVEYIRQNQLRASEETEEMWQILEKGGDIGLWSSKSVSPLLSTKWNQGCHYNAMCPADPAGPCGRVVTGCVATAMAQVIRYFEHPVNGTGNKCYTHYKYGELCADFSTANYNYSLMPNNLSSSNAEVAKLMYHCGVAVSMNYGPGGSGAFSSSVAHGMRNFYDYTNGLIIGKGSYTEDNWARIMKSELHNNRPMYYSGHGTGGHAFVLDGYQETNHFHINWGWGGSYNGYFYLNALNPGSMNFTSGQQAIVGMIPTANFTGMDFSSAIDLTCKTPVAGDISLGNDYVNYYKNFWPAAVGKELVYRFTTSLPGRIRVKITNETESVYTFLLNHPHKDSLVTYGTNGLTIDDTQPGTYYIVVEGQAGHEPTFTLEVVCPTTDADLDIQSAGVTPRYIQSLQENITLSSRIKNIGNAPATACTIEYYLSDDTHFDYGTDLYLGSDAIPSLNQGQSTIVNTVITMPDGLTPGFYYVIFVADRENTVQETDDENYFAVYVTVPESGIMDCSTSIELEDGIWYHGNTQQDGVNNMEEYSMGWEMTGPEVIHSFTPEFSGVVNISFVEKSPAMLYAMVMPICNEKTAETSLRIHNLIDTLITEQFYAIAGNTYYIVVDGYKGAFGDYGLLVELPKECPEIKVEFWGKMELCDGDFWPGFWTYWGHNNYQWFKDGSPVAGATTSSFSPNSPGDYHVEITENGCTGSSEIFRVRMDMPPDTARIASAGDLEFCSGGSVTLQLDNTVSYPVNWAKDDVMIEGATENLFSASETGNYSLYTINGVCAIESENSIKVKVLAPPVDTGEQLPFPSDHIEFYYPFTRDNNDVSGNNYQMVGWDYEPADDRFGYFWQARYLRGESEKLYSSNYREIPAAFTLALWIKSTTTKGGLIAGFFDNPWGPAKMEAILYMSDNGKLHFWLSNEGTPVELSTSSSYNDGNWHLVRIQHDGATSLEINDSEELLSSAGDVNKQTFEGYWSIGGPDIPVGVSDRPTSQFFNGFVDDILCINEGSDLVTSYMLSNPTLEILRSDNSPICSSGQVIFDLPFSQKGIEYRVWNNTLSVWHGAPVVGIGGPVQIAGGPDIDQSTEFHFVANNLTTNCELTLSKTIQVEVHPVETPSIALSSDAVVPLCAGTTVIFTANPAHAGVNPEIKWFVNGVDQNLNNPIFSLLTEQGNYEVFAKVITFNPCATASEAVSETISLVADVCTAIDDPEELKRIKVYPVPARDEIFFETSQEIRGLQIFDSTGRLVYTSTPYNNIKKIQVENWNSGFYYYKITTEDKTITSGKIIIAK